MEKVFRKVIVIIASVCFIVQEMSSAPATDSDQNGTLNGKTLIEMGNKLQKPLLRLVGKTLISVENGIKEEIRSEILKKICLLHPCTQWSEWSKCDSLKYGEFGGQNRSRNCGFNTTLCERYADTSVEYEYRVCESTCPVIGYVVSKHGFCLKLYNEMKTRDEAEEVCQKEQGHLVNIDSFEKVHDVNKTLGEYSYSYDNLWIDGRRFVQGGPWEYGYKPSDSSFTYWGDNDPDNGASELCMMYHKHLTHGYSWRNFDTACSVKRGFMCEIKFDRVG